MNGRAVSRSLASLVREEDPRHYNKKSFLSYLEYYTEIIDIKCLTYMYVMIQVHVYVRSNLFMLVLANLLKYLC